MKKHSVLLCILVIPISLFCQITITLQPGPLDGKDAKVWSNQGDTNFGDEIEIKANAWTWSGVSGLERTYFQFNLDNIPDDAELCYAKLSLYSTIPTSSQTNSQEDGTNETILSRVVDDWDEHTITWNTQPSISDIHQVIIPPSTADYEDVLDIDVTDLVQDMLDNPLSFGFSIQLETEVHYRRRIFATSDAADETHHPKLELCYTTATQISDMPSASFIQITPNPFSSYFSIYLPDEISSDIVICITDITGKCIYSCTYTEADVMNKTIHIDGQFLNALKGVGILTLSAAQGTYSQKIIKL